MTLSLERLVDAVAHDAALRRVQRLQPVGGSADKIFPQCALAGCTSSKIDEKTLRSSMATC